MKKISAKVFIEDIQSGLEDSNLMKKHGISSIERLAELFNKLVDGGYLKQSDIDNRYSSFICPSCGKTQSNEFEECQYCGVIVSKYLDKIKKDYPQKDQIENNNSNQTIKDKSLSPISKESINSIIDRVIQSNSKNNIKKILSLCLFLVLVFGYKLILPTLLNNGNDNQPIISEAQPKSSSETVEIKISETPTIKKNDNDELDESYPYFNFRKVVWGMSKDKVMKMEKSKLVCDDCYQDKVFDTILAYESTVANKEVGVLYHFINNEVVFGGYVLKENYLNKNKYIEDYNIFKIILRKNYGAPKIDKEIWKNDLYKDSPEHWGMAVSMGHLGFVSIWETSTTEITNLLTGDNLKASCIIRYESLDHRELINERKRKLTLSDF